MEPEISPPDATPSTSISNEVRDFQKGIKCDITLCPIFKDDRQYDRWLVTLGGFDISIAMSTLSLYRVAPQKGCLKCMKQLYGYVKHFPHAAVCIHTDITDYSEMVHESHEWQQSIYGDIEEELPLDMPIPLGKIIQKSSFFDANLSHDLVTGHAIARILHLVDQTAIEWYCKKQATVATATYSLEFITT